MLRPHQNIAEDLFAPCAQEVEPTDLLTNVNKNEYEEGNEEGDELG